MPKCAGCDVGVIEDIVIESLTTEVTLPFSKFSQQESNHPHNSFSTTCYSFFTVTVCRQTDANFSHSNSLTQFPNPHYPLQRHRLMFISFIKEDLLTNFHNLLQDGLLFVGFLQLEKNLQTFVFGMIYLTAIGLTAGGSSTVHINTQTIYGTTQKTQNNI
jgi:hypothetical protein